MAHTAESFCEVWGSPVAHSLSPALHRAAYEVLGLDWDYRYRDVTSGTLALTWEQRGSALAGLSLTMPLKEDIVALVEAGDPIVAKLQAANTVYRVDGVPTLSNTDPFGVEQALGHHGVSADYAWILGAGATARAVGYALLQRGTTRVTLCVRNPERAHHTAEVMSHWGLDVEVVPLTELDSVDLPQLVASTLPGNAEGLPTMPARVVATAALFDVAYSPWPSAFAHQWANSPQPIVSGLWMLAYQALAQIRLFVHGDVSRPLSAEDAVFRAMTDAVGLNSGS